MTDRPMIFSAPMVKALLDGRKTQTRRVFKHQPELLDGGKECRVCGHQGSTDYLMRDIAPRFWGLARIGDRLWVRETWQLHSRATDYSEGLPRPAHDKILQGGRVMAWETYTKLVNTGFFFVFAGLPFIAISIIFFGAAILPDGAPHWRLKAFGGFFGLGALLCGVGMGLIWVCIMTQIITGKP